MKPWLTAPLIAALLAGCGNGDDYPALLPREELLAEPALPPGADDPAAINAELSARAGALDRRVGGTGDSGGLNARAEALRQRAEALRRPAETP